MLHTFSMIVLNTLATGRCDCYLELVIFKLISRIDILCICCEIALSWMLQNAFDDMNTSIGNFFYYTSNAAENMSTSDIVICHLSNFCKIFILRRKPARGPFYQYRLILNSEWISNYIHHKVCDGITYPFPNFNSCSIEVWEWMLFHPTLYWTFHYLSMLGLKLTHLPSATYMHQWTGFVLV